jgi:hypothetical protein
MRSILRSSPPFSPAACRELRVRAWAQCLAALALLLAAQIAPAEAKRVALVIGNSGYKVGPLANPGRDADAVAGVFLRLGFDKVLLRKDLGVDTMRTALRELNREAAGAEIAVLFYAGHGTEVAGRNYLIPVDARLERAADVELEAIGLETVVGQLQGASGLKLVILDACRNNIFPLAGAKRSQSRGLARVEPEDNTLVAYAAREGTVADDGAGGSHSPYTVALLQHLGTPGLDVQFVFRRTRDDVVKATGGQQVPYVYGTLGGDPIYLLPPGPAAALPTAAKPDPPKPPEIALAKPAGEPRAPEASAAITMMPPAIGESLGALFSDSDEKRVEAIAKKHGLMLPVYVFEKPRDDVPAELRRFVGVWASERGYGGNGRQAMLIVTRVDASGVASGFHVHGPSTPATWEQIPPGYNEFRDMRIAGERLTFATKNQAWTAVLDRSNRIGMFVQRNDGRRTSTTMLPIWTLMQAEAAAKGQPRR